MYFSSDINVRISPAAINEAGITASLFNRACDVVYRSRLYARFQTAACLCLPLVSNHSVLPVSVRLGTYMQSQRGGSGATFGGRRLPAGRVIVWLRSRPGGMLSPPASRADELLSDTIGVRFGRRGAANVLPTAGRRYIDKIGICDRILDKEHPQGIDNCIGCLLCKWLIEFCGGLVMS